MRASVLKSVVTSLIIGLFWGALTGFIEALILLRASMNPYLSNYVIFDSTISYSIFWGALGVLLGITLTFLPRKGVYRTEPLQHMLFFFFSAFYVLGYYINLFFLPQFFATISLVFDAALTLLLGVVGIFLYRKISAFISRGRPGRLRILGGSACFAGWITIMLLSFSLTMWLPPGTPGARAVEQDFGITGPPEPRYNVLILSIDTLRKDHMSFYGYHRDTTPNINRYFRDGGAWFPNAFSQSSHTKPSTASLLTSLYVSTHNMSRLNAGLSEDATTATEIFKSIGYATSIFAANNFISPFFGFDQGVDYFFGHHPREITATGLYNALFAFKMSGAPVLSDVGDVSIRLIDSIDLKPIIRPEKTMDVSDESITRVLLDWIEEHKEERFFTYVHYIAPHDPYEPPAPFDQLYVPYPDAGNIARFEYSGFLPFKAGDPVDEKELANTLGQYDGEINYIDTHIGRIFERLLDLGLASKTLIVLTSDHGEEFFEHNGWIHGHSLYNELNNVPLIIRQPSLIQARGEIKAMIQQVDLLPTLLDILGYSVPRHMQGISFADMLTDTLTVNYNDHLIFMEIDWGGHGAKSIIKDGYKLIDSYYGTEKSKMLYNLKLDPNETRELSQIETAIVESLEGNLKEILELTSRSELEGQELMLNEDIKDELRALGYIK